MESVCRARVLLRPTPAELLPLAVKVVVATWRIMSDVCIILANETPMPSISIANNAYAIPHLLYLHALLLPGEPHSPSLLPHFS